LELITRSTSAQPLARRGALAPGGRDNISAQQAAIIDLAVKNKLILDSIDRCIFRQPSFVNKRKRTLLPS
jgi:hypothetical protein